MLTYNNLIEKALEKLPEFKKAYNELPNKLVYEDSGSHIVFELVFANELMKLIKDKNISANDFFDFMVDMIESKDVKVQEVCEQSVIESICDEFTDEQLKPFLPTQLESTVRDVREYIPSN